jgi:prolyl oligopeptidase
MKGMTLMRFPGFGTIAMLSFLSAPLSAPADGGAVADDPQQFPWLYAYSPYHHVKPGTKYPAALFITGDSDTRVAPLHARKMTALVQASTGSDRPVLLHYDTKAGRSRGSTPIPKQIEDLTDELAFLFAETNPAAAVPVPMKMAS